MANIRKTVMWHGYRHLGDLFAYNLMTKITAVFLLLASSVCVTDGKRDVWNVTCPSTCSCAEQRVIEYPDWKPVRTVDCQRKKLRELPKNLPFDAEVLLMKDNAISRILPGDLDDLSQLKLLDLSYNSLSELEPSLFNNLTSLQVLKLAGNRLLKLRNGVFNTLSNLEEISLTHNKIELIETEAFFGLSSLQSLTLSHNDLTLIQPDLFYNLSSLQQLYLDNNRLEFVGGESFLTLTSLTRLSLSHNNLTVLSSNIFLGLTWLTQLDLSYNQLKSVPSLSLSVFRRLKLLTLDSNFVKMLGSGSFQNLNIGEICLRNITSLRSVDIQSVVNIPQLHTLRIHGNKNLVFIHPQAFEHLPQLEYLYLHDNGILGLSSDLVLSLPSLQMLSFYGNPLKCDCNANWLLSALTNRTFYTANATVMATLPPVDHVTFQKPQSYICNSPSNLQGKVLSELSISTFTAVCGPSVIALFQDSYQKELGKSVVLDCRAIGVPFPHIHWILSNGKVVNNTSNYSRIRVSRTGTLSINHLKAQDAGTYTCVATSDVSYDTESTVLRVHSKNIQIIGRGATNNYITVSWNGTESTIATSDYMILYHVQGSTQDYKRIHLRPYMRKYVVSNLEPDTPYELCIAYEHSGELVKLNCVTIRTKSQLYMIRGIQTISKLTIILALCLTSLGVFLICILTVIIRRYQRRKSYQEPSGSAEGSSQPSGTAKPSRLGHRFGPTTPNNYNVSQLSNIPLDNLYNPPTTPLCTSTTSLISTQSNA